MSATGCDKSASSATVDVSHQPSFPVYLRFLLSAADSCMPCLKNPGILEPAEKVSCHDVIRIKVGNDDSHVVQAFQINVKRSIARFDNLLALKGSSRMGLGIHKWDLMIDKTTDTGCFHLGEKYSGAKLVRLPYLNKR